MSEPTTQEQRSAEFDPVHRIRELEDALAWALEQLDQGDPKVRAAWDLVDPENPTDLVAP